MQLIDIVVWVMVICAFVFLAGMCLVIGREMLKYCGEDKQGSSQKVHGGKL